MLGHKVREFKPLTAICLEDLMPANNFYRQVELRFELFIEFSSGGPTSFKIDELDFHVTILGAV